MSTATVREVRVPPRPGRPACDAAVTGPRWLLGGSANWASSLAVAVVAPASSIGGAGRNGHGAAALWGDASLL